MKHLEIGSPISIIAYKHNGEFHRLWRKGTILSSSSNRIIIMNNKTLVRESNDKEWYTKEPAICVFYTKKWFNVICMLKPSGIHFYCNLSSPVIIDGKRLKYIDYDLDIRYELGKRINVLDKKEYLENKEKYNYSKEIEKIVFFEIENIKKMIIQKKDPFNENFVFKWQNKYEENLENS